MNTKDDAFLELTQQLNDDEKLRNSNQTLKGHETCERAIASSISPYNILNANEIRLIDILPGSHTDPIKVTLRTVNLAIISRYEALSYVWDPKDETINLSAKPVSFVLQGDYDFSRLATPNLASAIRHLRRVSGVRTM
jgi:hypothetical protein